MKMFKAPQYWEDINKLVQEGRFLEPFENFWGFQSDEFNIIMRADELGAEIHKDDIRESNGEPYIYHPRRSAIMLIRLNNHGPYVTAAALLHDTHEDHPDVCPLSLIESEFSITTRVIVEGLSKPSRVGLENYQDVYKRLTSLKVNAAGDNSVIVKGTERNDNIITLYGSIEKQIMYLAQTERYILPLTVREPCLHQDIKESIARRREYLTKID